MNSLKIASAGGSCNTIEVLIRHGADINDKNHVSTTILDSNSAKKYDWTERMDSSNDGIEKRLKRCCIMELIFMTRIMHVKCVFFDVN
jgi:ankyrin repeat protein